MKPLLILICFFLSHHQSISEKINWKHFDKESFNHFFIKKVMKLRKGSKLSFDSTCYLAAELHGLYLANNKISITEFSEKKEGTYGAHLERLSPFTKTMNQRLSFFRKRTKLSCRT